MVAGASYKVRREVDQLCVKDIYNGLKQMAATDSIGFFFRHNLWGLMTLEERSTLLNFAKGSVMQRTSSRMREFFGVRKNISYPEALANLNSQGILANGKIAIGLLQEWIRESGIKEV
jgi:hypothetical protein